MKNSHRIVLTLILLAVMMVGLIGNLPQVSAFNSEGQDLQTNPNPQVAIEQVPFNVTSPRGSGTLVGQNYKWNGNLHQFPMYDVRLVRQDGTDAGWMIPAIVFAAWSANGTTFAMEDVNHRVYVGTLYSIPTALPGSYTTPALSPSGEQLTAQKLGDGENIFDQITNSPGIILRNLSTGAERVVVSDDVYAPFFIDKNRLGFGSGKGDNLASLYMIHLKSGKIARLTNRASDPAHLDPFPVSFPVLDKDGKHLNFTTTEDGVEKKHRILIPNFSNPTAHATKYRSSVRKEMQSSKLGDSLLNHTNSSNMVAAAKVLFQRPLPNYQGVSAYFYHNINNRPRDWGCGSVTYAVHMGTDFTTGGVIGIPVYAAAQGSIYQRYDGCPDYGQRGSTCGGGFGNHIRMEHSDGRVTIYAHMKKGTPIGIAGVSCGRYIGSTASSGNSSGPHLHFELRNSRTGTAIDPYYGSCDTGSSTDWISQLSYPNGNTRHSCLPSWFFNSVGNHEGWTPYNAAATAVHDGILFIDPGAGDFYIPGPLIGVVAASNQYVQFRMGSNAADNRGKIYFKTRVENYYSEDKSIAFTVNNCALCGNASFYTYTIYAAWHPKWANTITGIRLDPAEGGTGGTNRDSIGIDYIRITTQ